MRPSHLWSLATLLLASPSLAAAQELAGRLPLDTNTVLGCWRLAPENDASQALAEVGVEVRSGSGHSHAVRQLFRSDDAAWSHRADPGEWTEPGADSLQMAWREGLFHFSFVGRLSSSRLHGHFVMSHDNLDGALSTQVTGYRLDCAAFPER